MLDMNPTMPLLSLCLPTYKRALLLREALDAVLGQISPAEAGLVDVLVLDNASPDETPAVVEACGREAPHVRLRYLRHAQNVGMDANFLAAMQQAQGKFVCLLSDDDILLPGAVAKLLTLIQAHPDFDGFCLNVSSFRGDPYKEAPVWLDLNEDTILQNKNEVLQLIRGRITFLSILVFRKERIADRLAAGYYQSKIGTYFVQSYLFLDVIASGSSFVIVARPMVAQRVDNAHTVNYFQLFITEITTLLDYAEAAGFSSQIISQSKTENLIGARHFVATVKIYGRQTELWSSRPDAIRRLFQVYGFHPYLWSVVVPLMFFPRFLRPVVFAVRRLLGRPDIPGSETNG